MSGRRHIEIQTETLYEELDDAFPVAEGATQTDAFLDQPPTPLFIPKKSGDDVATQILPGTRLRPFLGHRERTAGELFDFDEEVKPIVTYIVGRTLEQSLVEVHEERERVALEQRREALQQRRNFELAAVHKMEAVEKRLIEEKERRLHEVRERGQVWQ